jgi:hypothetical protein
LERVANQGLLVGKTMGIDATTLEANAAMRSIVRRDTGEGYQEFLTNLAKESGIETPTREALARLDRKRFPYPRPVLRDPTQHFLLIALLGAAGRLLERPVHRTQDLPDVARVVVHARQLLDHAWHPGQRPQLRRETIRHRALAKGPIQLLQVLPVEPGLELPRFGGRSGTWDHGIQPFEVERRMVAES